MIIWATGYCSMIKPAFLFLGSSLLSVSTKMISYLMALSFILQTVPGQLKLAYKLDNSDLID
jgi:hypothetical protein